MPLKLNNLHKAIQALEDTIQITKSAKFATYDPKMQQALIAGVIQHFEFTYELCWKYMRRFLEMQLGKSSFLDGMTRTELFRLSAENQLIHDVSVWKSYHNYRNLTAHVYDQDIANEIFMAAQQFLLDAKNLLMVLEAKND